MAAIRVALVGDHSESVLAHRAIPLALAMAGQAMGHEVSFDWIGTIRVNMNDEHRPATASTATMAPCRGIRVSRRLASSSPAPIRPGYRRRRAVARPRRSLSERGTSETKRIGVV